MATLVLTAVGTALGGPLGGAIGSLVGNQLDHALIGNGQRQGARLKELAITTSSYGTPIPRHFGKMRVAGSIIWATDIREASERTGGGKGRPATTSFSYSASFAVALSSRPISGLGRIWADGNLLRGAAGDLKTGGELRIYHGHGDQPVDPLIASDQGLACPAFRGLAYCVFEGLQLADFGNRIPALTFEIIAGDGAVTLAEVLEPLDRSVSADRPLTGLAGYSDAGGPLSATLATLADLYPFGCDCMGDGLTLFATDATPEGVLPTLSEPAIDPANDGFGAGTGQSGRRAADQSRIPEGLRYYDRDRDYQAGMQRADGRARAGRGGVLEFPGTLAAQDARDLANAAAERAGWSRDTMSWRIAALDPALKPGSVVRLPGKTGQWRIETWEWRESGIELELRRLPHGPARSTAADAGQVLAASDAVVTPTLITAFGLPWDGAGSRDNAPIYLAASSATAGWTGAALFAVDPLGALNPVGASGSHRSILGTTRTVLAPGSIHMLDSVASVEVDLVAPDLLLGDATAEQLAMGANRALVGGELCQFARAQRLDAGRWKLSGLLRGRGGTEGAALLAHAAGTAFVLLDGTAVAIDAARVPQPETIAAIGLADSQPVIAVVINPRIGTVPLCPVHGQFIINADGSMVLVWCRRARGGWAWQDHVDTPLNEEGEKYLVGVGQTDSPVFWREVTQPGLTLLPAERAALAANHPGAPVWVRQIGNQAASIPLLLGTIA
ncbi:MAG: hypothetical protein RLZZ08_64 [Pseudomonadota bacterium]|jgi:hypothetical protein